MSSVNSPTPSITTPASNVLSATATRAIDLSDPYDSISHAILYNSSSSIASFSTNSETCGGSSSSFFSSQEALCDTSSPPSLYLSSDIFHFPYTDLTNSSNTTTDTSIIPYMGTSSFASSNRSSSSLDLSIHFPVATSDSQAIEAASASRSLPNDAILQDIQNASAVSSMSSLSSTRPVHSTQPLKKHQRARSLTGFSFPSNEVVILQAIQNVSAVFSISSLSSTRPVHSPQSLNRSRRARSFSGFSPSPSVSLEQGADDHRELSSTRKNSIASTTSISSGASSNYSERTTPSTQIDQIDLLANVSTSRRGSRLLLTAEQIDEIVEKRFKELQELQEQNWTLVIYDKSREDLLKKAVTEKDKKIVSLVDRTDVLEHALNMYSKQCKYLWAHRLAEENQYYNNLAVKHAKYQMSMEKLNEALRAEKNQSAQLQQELSAEKSKIEKLLKEVETIFGNREAFSRSRNSASSNSQTSSSTSSLSTSSASSDSAPKTEVLHESPSYRTESTSSQKPQSYWFCVIC